ncbi:MAG: glycosyltransferase [Candidatus Pacearchaeota archaeon]
MVLSFIDYVFLFYTFIGLYMISLMILVYFPNRKEMFYHPKGKPCPVSIVVSCYNAASNIGNLVKRLQNLDWPKDMIEIIIVDDCSTDGSQEIIKKYAKKYDNIRYILREKNFGRAAGPLNQGIKIAKYDYIVVCDDDSDPDRDALKKMIGFIQEDKDIKGVTSSVLVRNPKKFIEKLQAIEYVVIAFARKLLDFVDAVYVTPGPFALYEKKALMEVGLFDEENMTQDIEIVWKLMSYGYKARMSLDARTYVDSPKNKKSWWKQRIRWNIGGMQTLWKYRGWTFRKSMLGLFVIPFFSFSAFVGIFGVGILTYLTAQRFLSTYFTTTSLSGAEVPILVFQGISINPSIVNFFGFSLFILGTLYIIFGISTMKELRAEYIDFYSMTAFLTIYLTVFPLNLIHSFVKMARRNYSW